MQDPKYFRQLANNNLNRGTPKLKKFLEENAQSMQLSPLSKLLSKPMNKYQFQKFNAHDSPIAAKINTFDNEGYILNQLSQRGSTPESTGSKCSMPVFPGHFAYKQNNITVSKMSNPLPQTYKVSMGNSIGTRKLERFLQEHSQDPWNKSLSSILNMPAPRKPPKIIINSYKNSLIHFKNKAANKNSEKTRLKRSIVRINTASSSGKSGLSFESIRKKNSVLHYFKETNIIKKSLEKNNFADDSDIVCWESDFGPASEITSFPFVDDNDGCARTKAWSNLNSSAAKEETDNKKTNKNTINLVGLENEYASSLFKGLDFIEEFDKEYDKELVENDISKPSSNGSSSSKSYNKRKYQSQKLDYWLRNNPIKLNNSNIMDYKSGPTNNSLNKSRRASSEISFKTKARSSHISRNKNKSEHKLTNLFKKSSKQEEKIYKSESKNSITNYFPKNKLVHNSVSYSRHSFNLRENNYRSSDNKEKVKQFPEDENKIGSANKIAFLGSEMNTNKKNSSNSGSVNWNKKSLTNQIAYKKRTNVTKKLRQNSEKEIYSLLPTTKRKIQKNLYSSEGFCESLSLESPIPKPSDNRKSYISINTSEKHSDLIKVENSHKFGLRKKDSIRDTEKFKEISSFMNSCCSQPQKLSEKPERRRLTQSEERELSPDYYVMKMCGPDSEALVKKILNSHKNEESPLINHKNEDKSLVDSLHFTNLEKIIIANKDSPSDPLSFGSPSVTFSGNELCSQVNKVPNLTNRINLSFENADIMENQARNTFKRKYDNLDTANLYHCENKQNIPISYSCELPKSKNSSQVSKNSQITQKQEKLNSQTLKRLYKLHESNSWHTQELAHNITNLKSQYSLEKHINPIEYSKKINKEITQMEELPYQSAIKEILLKKPELSSSKNITESHVIPQNTFLSSEIFGTQSNSNTLSAPIDDIPLFLTKKINTPIIKADNSKDTNDRKYISTKIGSLEAQNTCNNALLQELLSQHFENTLNKNYSDLILEGIKNNERKENTTQGSQINVCQMQENCKTEMNSEQENLMERIFGNQSETQNSGKKLKKTYNITKDCVLYEDNLLKTLVEDENIWKMYRKKNSLKRTNSEVPLKYGGSYIKRYKKGDIKIFKIKRRIKKKHAINYRPPESQVMDRFIKKLNKDFKDDTSSDSAENKDDESVSTPVSYKTDETKSEVLSTGSSKLTDAQKLLRQGINKLSKDKSLLFSKFEDAVPKNFDKSEIIDNIEHIVNTVLKDFKDGKNPFFRVPKEDITNCFFADGRYQMKEPPEYATVSYKASTSRQKFNLILFLLNKLKKLLETNTKLTKREVYYQLKTIIKTQGTTDRALKEIGRMLNVGLWALNITAQKGMVYGNLKLVTEEGETINCNVPGTLIPQDISKICEVQSTAYFILVVEKESIFHKLLEENLPNRLTRPFILITGKGFPDLNTQLFLKKLWMIMSIPVFILVDADPDGIAIMLNYRFGSIANAHVSGHLAIPKAKWLGVFPSEILRLSLSYENLTKREISMTQKLLQLECVAKNENIKMQLEKLLENGIKTGIEGLIKSETYLSNSYLSWKFFTNNLI